jgi:2,5-diamino-6-(ribosylamino)-4(3H)-pyrimidinone 5'-phosphate reductase
MKPHVTCHMCTTIDGRILGSRWGEFPGQKRGENLFEKTHDLFKPRAWFVGTTTMKEFADKPARHPAANGRMDRKDHIANANAKKLAIGVDARGVLTYKSSETHGDHVVLIITQQVTNAYLAHLQAAGVSYLFCGKHEVDLHVALDKLSRGFKLKKLMLEGGGKMNGSFLKAGLIDEISHIIVPVADGGVGVSTIFDIPGEAPEKAAAHLKLLSRKNLPGGVTWFKYKVVTHRL